LILGALILLAGCGGASLGGASTAQSSAGNTGAQQHSIYNGNSSAPASTPLPGSNGGSSGGRQYLIKSLQVNLQLSDTRRAAADLQAWIMTTDPKATSAGMTIDQGDNDQYTVTMTFSVQASLYPQIQRYLADYAGQHGGKLASLRETVQDVTNDYVDTQSRLANLRAEQQRLQTLMSQATSLPALLTTDHPLPP